MATVKFWQGMDKASNIVGVDKMMIGKNETGEAQYVDFQDANQFLSIQGIEMKPVTAGALPAGPAGETRTMEILEAGTWTYGGNSFVNPSGSIMKLWWDGTTWSLGTSVPLPRSISKMQVLPKTDIDKVRGNYQLFNKNDYVPNMSFTTTNVDTTLSGAATTKYINIPNTNRPSFLSWNGLGNSSARRVAWMTEENGGGTLISVNTVSVASATIAIPATAKSFRFFFQRPEDGDVTGVFMLNFGSQMT